MDSTLPRSPTGSQCVYRALTTRRKRFCHAAA